ncbi:putative [histone H3]-lysine(4) N-trimethyltransferase [Helianthus anomalus]
MIYFKDGLIKNLESEIIRANKLKCSSCGKKGAGLGCCRKLCQKTYHVPCAYDIPDCRWDVSNDFCTVWISAVIIRINIVSYIPSQT